MIAINLKLNKILHPHYLVIGNNFFYQLFIRFNTFFAHDKGKLCQKVTL